jgi:hypothetical protein
MAQELVRMSAKELDRVDVVRRVIERRLTQVKVAELKSLTSRSDHSFEALLAQVLAGDRRGYQRRERPRFPRHFCCCDHRPYCAMRCRA